MKRLNAAFVAAVVVATDVDRRFTVSLQKTDVSNFPHQKVTETKNLIKVFIDGRFRFHRGQAIPSCSRFWGQELLPTFFSIFNFFGGWFLLFRTQEIRLRRLKDALGVGSPTFARMSFFLPTFFY